MTDHSPTHVEPAARVAALERELAEARAEQAAIADVLGIISEAPALATCRWAPATPGNLTRAPSMGAPP